MGFNSGFKGLKPDKNNRYFTWRPNIHFWTHLAHFFLEWEIFQTIFVEKKFRHTSHVQYYIFFPHENRAVLWDNVEKSVEITNKMQPCNRIYYSNVHWRLNMFRAAYRSSSGALTVFSASGLHTHVLTGRIKVWVPTQTWLRPVTTFVCKSEAASTV